MFEMVTALDPPGSFLSNVFQWLSSLLPARPTLRTKIVNVTPHHPFTVHWDVTGPAWGGHTTGFDRGADGPWKEAKKKGGGHNSEPESNAKAKLTTSPHTHTRKAWRQARGVYDGRQEAEPRGVSQAAGTRGEGGGKKGKKKKVNHGRAPLGGAMGTSGTMDLVAKNSPTQPVGPASEAVENLENATLISVDDGESLR